jgi:hypothetical protein
MAGESTTTTINDFAYSAVISTFIMATLAEHSLPMTWCKEFNLIGQPSASVDVGYFDSNFGSAEDNGAGVDAEYDATEATALGNTAIASSKYTIAAAEYGIAVELTDNVNEDSVSGVDILNQIQAHQQRALALAWTKDFVDLFSSISNSVGTTTSALTVAQMLAAQVGPRKRGVLADDGMAYVLENNQTDNLEAELISTNAAAAVYAAGADRLLGVGAGTNNGMGASRHVLTFRGYPVYSSGLNPTANAAADVVGCCFTPDGPNNGPFASFGNVIKRAPRLEPDRSAKARSSDLVLTMRMAPGELVDASATAIITDAG